MAITGLRVILSRFSYFGYHHLLMTLIAVSVICISVLLAGCSPSSGILRNVYILSVADTLLDQGGRTSREIVRAGYFGICSHAEDVPWICTSPSSQPLADLGTSDPSHIVQMMKHFSTNVIFPGLPIAGVFMMLLAFFALSTFPNWSVEVDARTGSEIDIKPFPSRPVSRAAAAALELGSLILLVSAMWQHVAAASAASMISTSLPGQLETHVGPAAVALAWIAFAMAALPAVGIEIMITSIKLLDELTDE